MSAISPDDLVRITDYVAGELAASELAETERWIREDESRTALVDYFRRSRQAHQAVSHVQADAMAQRFADAFARRSVRGVNGAVGAARPRVVEVSQRKDGVYRSSLWRVMIGVCTLLVTGTVVTRVAAPPSTPETSRIYRTAPGQQQTITLPTGSTIVLGPVTTLRYSASSARSPQHFVVDGQALFTIDHDESAPTTVTTVNSVVRVLGTTFFVRQYPADRDARVGVVSGRILVSTRRAHAPASVTPRVLAPGMVGVVADSGAIVVTPNAAMDRYTAWAEGTLVFRNTPVRDVLDELSRAYAVEIRLSDSAVAAQRLTWSVPTNRYSLGDVLANLPLMLDVHLTRSGNVITVAPGRHASRKSVTPSLPLSKESSYGL
jgi:transmembrane sensor